jgi:sulfhydrogenase subunit delta
MGPVTQTGCGALCPSYNRGCFSCFGPKETPNTIAMSDAFGDLGVKEDDIIRFYRTFNAYAEPFRKESEAYER